ncbi:MAG TPA: uL15 family ribosomal protein [Candidatus Nanoarchaeia archaeon]|nr:uL15 family ribosomal protein [Candidatus Nanoarchaeia archaeon]
MVTYKRKKVGKYRGGSTHGGGARKKRRGAGSRGGRGNAGSGKRAGHMRMRYVKAGHILGKHGFTSKNVSVVKAVNLSYFTSDRVAKLVKQGKAHKEGNVYAIDLAALGYNKLLGTGTTPVKLKLTVESSSASAAEKIAAAGGEVIVSDSKAGETKEQA